MKIPSLPIFIKKLYYRLYQEDLSKEERAKSLHTAFLQSISFLGKLWLLEYLQSKTRSESLNYYIFSSPYPNTPQQWVRLIRKLYDHLKDSSLVLFPLLKFCKKYQSLRCEKKDSKDAISKLCWFYDLVRCGNYVISISDIQENAEALDHMLENFEFLDMVCYQVENERTGVFLNDKVLWLEPFYRACIGEDGQTLEKKRTREIQPGKKFCSLVDKSI